MWDAAFAIQAILSCNLSEEYGSTLRKAHDFVKASQVGASHHSMPFHRFFQQNGLQKLDAI